ncbi:MAG: radical SAM protein, partial [Calditrichaeota bacterium]
MNLGPGDLLYFSPLVSRSRPGTRADTPQEVMGMLGAEELEQQRREMVDGIGLPSGAEAPKVATYDIGEFIY